MADGNPLVDLSGLDHLQVRFKRLAHPNAGPLMVSWMKIMHEDNRRGILAGTDKDGVAMKAVTYRPVGPPKRPGGQQRNEANARARYGHYGGFGPHAAGLHNNLTSAEYRRLGGPPLAPRGASSRVITNYKTDYAELRPGYWQATSWWDEVVSSKGVPFLRYHFDGAGRLPRRDLRGVRPEGMRLATMAAKNWASDMIRSAP